MLKVIAVVVLVLIAVVLTLALTQPDSFSVERSALIKSPPERIYALIDDLQAFGTWSPYEKKDPAMKRTFSGARSGKGAIYEWDGNSQVGTGRIEITEAVPPSRVAIKLDMLAPIEGHNIVVFTLEPQGEFTKVSWTLNCPTRPFVAKLLGLFVNMDKMVGADFEAGLSDLKAMVET
jgi:uncharacterized protein YndB with AHSA1/START domain